MLWVMISFIPEGYTFCLSKKSWPIIYSMLLYKFGQALGHTVHPMIIWIQFSVQSQLNIMIERSWVSDPGFNGWPDPTLEKKKNNPVPILTKILYSDETKTQWSEQYFLNKTLCYVWREFELYRHYKKIVAKVYNLFHFL